MRCALQEVPAQYQMLRWFTRVVRVTRTCEDWSCDEVITEREAAQKRQN